MSDNENNTTGLSDAERERLAILAEECAEIIHIVSKIQRHGFESCDPGDRLRVTNRDLLDGELQDLSWIVGMMVKEKDIPTRGMTDMELKRIQRRKEKFLHFQPNA